MSSSRVPIFLQKRGFFVMIYNFFKNYKPTVVCIKFRQPLFQDSGKVIHSAEINDASYEWATFFRWDEVEKSKWPTQKIQNDLLKKTLFSSSANSQYFFMKISWIGPWVRRIDWCEGHWYGLTYMVVSLSNISSA